MANDTLYDFIEVLKAQGWRESHPYTYENGNWIIFFDTSLFMELGTRRTPRIFDVPVPQTSPIDRTAWTLNLITHLFETNDQIEKLSD